jgi:hypothetical protein
MLNRKVNTTLILPAAGFGTRVSADKRSGKELMEDPMLKAPLIEWGLQLGERLGWRVIVISRASKDGLNAYLESRNSLRVEVLKLDKPGKEWPDSILKSEDKWTDFNVMVLPDTRFSNPLESVQAVRNGLIADKVKLGCFRPEGYQHEWQTKYACRLGGSLIEKMPFSIGYECEAIGVFGFRKSAGNALFKGFSERGKWFRPPGLSPSDINLEWFKDITRNGKVEEYEYEYGGL